MSPTTVSESAKHTNSRTTNNGTNVTDSDTQRNDPSNSGTQHRQPPTSSNDTLCPIAHNPYTMHNQNSSYSATVQQTASTTTSEQAPQRKQGLVDKHIELKRGNFCQHIHRYTLRLKIITSRSEEKEQDLVKSAISSFFHIMLKADSKTIIPPYFDLDRGDRNTPDLSQAFMVNSLDSLFMVKKHFSKISPRKPDGSVWCSVILAQTTPLSVFMEKAKPALENQSFSLWPKASDHEITAE
jgi:hypothetical protein